MSYEEVERLIKQYQEDGFEIIDIELIGGNVIGYKRGINKVVFYPQGTEIKIIGMGCHSIIDINSIVSISI